MLQNEPNWQFYLFDKDGQVLSDQNDGTNENISPNWTKGNEEANKVSSKRETIQDFIDGQKKIKTVSYETKSYLNIFSRYLAKEKETRNIEAIPAGELDTYFASSWQFANKMVASRQICIRCKQALSVIWTSKSLKGTLKRTMNYNSVDKRWWQSLQILNIYLKTTSMQHQRAIFWAFSDQQSLGLSVLSIVAPIDISCPVNNQGFCKQLHRSEWKRIQRRVPPFGSILKL